MKKLGKIFIVVFLIIVVLVLARNVVIKSAVSAGVKAVTGLTLEIERLNIGFPKTLIDIGGLKLNNPSGFKDRVMVSVPEVYVDYSLGAFLKKKINLSEVRLNIEEFLVVRNEDGKLNLDALKPVQSAKKEKDTTVKKEKGDLPQISIDKLSLKIGKVVYKDYSQKGTPKQREFKVNINEEYRNIKDPQELVRLIVAKALMNTTIASLTNFDLGAVTDNVGEKIDKAKSSATEALGKVKGLSEETKDKAQEAMEKASEGLKKMFPSQE